MTANRFEFLRAVELKQECTTLENQIAELQAANKKLEAENLEYGDILHRLNERVRELERAKEQKELKKIATPIIPEHTTECGTKYRGCSPECKYQEYWNNYPGDEEEEADEEELDSEVYAEDLDRDDLPTSVNKREIPECSLREEANRVISYLAGVIHGLACATVNTDMAIKVASNCQERLITLRQFVNQVKENELPSSTCNVDWDELERLAAQASSLNAEGSSLQSQAKPDQLPN